MAGTKTKKTFTAEEREAMKERARESKKGKANGESDVLEKLAEMPKANREMGERLHALIREAAPELAPRTWYGMPAYAKDGKVVCFYKPSEKFKARYSTLGFSDTANLDDGRMWPTEFALTELTAAEEKKIVKLVKRAVG